MFALCIKKARKKFYAFSTMYFDVFFSLQHLKPKVNIEVFEVSKDKAIVL